MHKIVVTEEDKDIPELADSDGDSSDDEIMMLYFLSELKRAVTLLLPKQIRTVKPRI